jgi:hypothetical protein
MASAGPALVCLVPRGKWVQEDSGASELFLRFLAALSHLDLKQRAMVPPASPLVPQNG